MTCADTSNAIFSQASADGPPRCSSPDGPATDLFGQALVRVNPLASPALSVAARMSATYGLRCFGSSESAALQQSLANKLAARLASRGSTMFALTWKAQATPLRRQICRLAASARRTDDSGCGGWPTPSARDWKDSPGMATTGTNPDGSQRTRLDQLPRIAHLTSGRRLSGYPVRTENSGQLNPAFSLWLMGFGTEWVSCGEQVTPSFRK